MNINGTCFVMELILIKTDVTTYNLSLLHVTYSLHLSCTFINHHKIQVLLTTALKMFNLQL